MRDIVDTTTTISCRSSSSSRRAASGRSTSSRACCASTSSSSIGPVDDGSASLVVAQLLFLEADNPKKEIAMYINSPGGVVTAGLSIYDTMQFIRPKVTTMCVGQAASMGSLLLAAGEKGMRYTLPNSRIMVHQPSGGFQGQASDIQRHAEDILKVKRRLNEIYVEHTGQSYEVIERTLDRDHFMSAEEAKAFGLVDEVTTKRAVETEEPKPI